MQSQPACDWLAGWLPPSHWLTLRLKFIHTVTWLLAAGCEAVKLSSGGPTVPGWAGAGAGAPTDTIIQ